MPSLSLLLPLLWLAAVSAAAPEFVEDAAAMVTIDTITRIEAVSQPWCAGDGRVPEPRVPDGLPADSGGVAAGQPGGQPRGH